METGGLGVLSLLAVSPAEGGLNHEPDFATIRHLPMAEQLVLDKAQKQQLAMNSIALLVKQIVALVSIGIIPTKAVKGQIFCGMGAGVRESQIG